MSKTKLLSSNVGTLLNTNNGLLVHTNQVLNATVVDEILVSKHGNDVLDGKGLAAVVNTEQGDDTAIYNLSEYQSRHTLYDGGKGFDTLEIRLTMDEFNSLRQELINIQKWIADHADVNNSTSMPGMDNARSSAQHPELDVGLGKEFSTSFGLTIRNFEDVKFVVDGVPMDPRAPITNPDVFDVPSSSDAVVAAPGVLENDSSPVADAPLTVTVDSHTLSPQTNFTWNDGIKDITLNDTVSNVTENADGSLNVNTGFFHGYYDSTYEVSNEYGTMTEDYTLRVNVDADGNINTGTDAVREVVMGSSDGEVIVANGSDDYVDAKAGGDVIIGDSVGGQGKYLFPEHVNLALTLDVSGSMSNADRYQTMINAVTSVLQDHVNAFETSPYLQDSVLNVHVNTFSSDLQSTITFNDVNISNYQDIITQISNLTLIGQTHYVPALEDAAAYFAANAVQGDINNYYFFSDGEPTLPQPDPTAVDYATVAPIFYDNSADVNIIPVAIVSFNTTQLDLLDDLQANNSVLPIDSLFDGSQFELPFNDGSDNLMGGAGDDIIFGDTIATEGLSQEIIDALASDLEGTVRAHHAELDLEGQNRGGNDIIDGGEGNDVIYGQAGDDVINGGAGDDTIVGGVGNDTLTGGLGADVFIFRNDDDSAHLSTDTIMDFEDGVDRLNISDYGITDYASQVQIIDTANGAVIHVDGTSQDILLHGVSMTLLDQSDFIM